MKRTAFVRCWNEEKTVIASLMSIENIFSNIVIIYSDITDNSLQLIQQYARGRSNFIIEKYPHHVFPHHHDVYKTKNFKYENSLAAYYNFGMSICNRIGGSICKIDCDQIYIEDVLSVQYKNLENCLLMAPHNDYMAGLWGINTFVHNNTLLISEDSPINGKFDHYITSSNMKIDYVQNEYYEVPLRPLNTIEIPFLNKPAWFHFRTRIFEKINDTETKCSIDEYIHTNERSIALIDDSEAQLFEDKIRPILLKSDSLYSKIKLE